MDHHAIEISQEIRQLLLQALKRKGLYFFNNPQLCNCWDEMNCLNSHCPSYKSSNLRCWQISGTYCNGEPQGEFAKKIGDCHKCRVYKKAVEGDVILQIGEDFNNLMFHLKTKENELRSIIQHSEEKNKELAALNKKIKSLLKKLDNKNTLLRELSIRDGLTGLYNYRFFKEILHEQYNLAKRFKFPLSCIMIDIDFFKAVNDTYGHQVGDAILSQLADILENNVRETDKVVRYGGEEFAILLPYTDYENAYAKAERLRKIVNDFTFKISGKTLGLTISIGITAYPANKNINLAEGLISYSDKALYQAKERGRNQTVIYADGKVLKGNNERAFIEKELIERRKYPRIQILIKIKGEMNKKEMSFNNTFDISCSGISVVSEEPIERNNYLKIKLYLPDIGKKNEIKNITPEGLVIWCRNINGFSGNRAGIKQKHQLTYMIGIQFTKISKKDSKFLQQYFVSMFDRGCTQ